MTTQSAASTELVHAVRCLALDRLAADLVGELEADGVPAIVLKGAAIATWLYRDRGARLYGDVDLLVPPGDWDRTAATLRRLGFADSLAVMDHPRMESITSYPWRRGADDVDLHCNLWGIGVEPERTWEVLSSLTVPMEVGGREVRVLAPAARAMHVALHLAQHGHGDAQPRRDLEAALDLLPHELWMEAREIASELDALPGFSTGLRFSPRGAVLAERLGVAGEASVEALLQVAHVPLAHGFEELATTPGLRGKLSVLAREFVPTPDFMRWWFPPARRGRLGLVAGYVWRPLYLALRAGPGLVAWQRARRAAAS